MVMGVKNPLWLILSRAAYAELLKEEVLPRAASAERVGELDKPTPFGLGMRENCSWSGRETQLEKHCRADWQGKNLIHRSSDSKQF